MNYRGSYRRLLGNAISAMLGAIELYNKPLFRYRDEVVSILLINAWELLLKAIVSKDGQSIYYPKKRGEPYRTLSCRDAFWKAANSSLWPAATPAHPIRSNVELIELYRDNSVHFYNNSSFCVLLYSLAQTSILNFRDIALQIFGKDIAKDISWRIMPLSFTNPIDPIAFMRGTETKGKERSRAVQEFLTELKNKIGEVETDGLDSSRLLTVFSVSLQSTKKVTDADVVVGVSPEHTDAVIVPRRIDPNVTYPYRQKELLPKLRDSITTHTFQAIVYAYKLRGDPKYWWADASGAVVRWSPETVRFIDSLSQNEITEAVRTYAEQFRR
jgi:EC042_2821-lke REase/Protein of unknown function (DUF3644)